MRKTISKTATKRLLKCVRDNLDCSICYNTMTTNVWQCRNGHSICENCKTRIHHCAYCQDHLFFRNRFFEELVQDYVVSCPNSKNGCKHKCKIQEMKSHESQCQYAPQMCPYCSEKIAGHEMVAHLLFSHEGKKWTLFPTRRRICNFADTEYSNLTCWESDQELKCSFLQKYQFFQTQGQTIERHDEFVFRAKVFEWKTKQYLMSVKITSEDVQASIFDLRPFDRNHLKVDFEVNLSHTKIAAKCDNIQSTKQMVNVLVFDRRLLSTILVDNKVCTEFTIDTIFRFPK